MTVQCFDSQTLTRQPWHNGGGMTREIVCQPTGATMQDFDWRISIADVTQDGPFSVLPGVDRCIVLLQGLGLRLHSPCGRLDHRLDKPGVPLHFDGGLAVYAVMLGGASEDFNVMTRAGRCTSQVRVLDGTDATGPSPQGLLLVLQGRWLLQPDPDGAHGAVDTAHAPEPETALTDGQGLWWQDGPLPYRLRTDDQEGRVLQVLIQPVQELVP